MSTQMLRARAGEVTPEIEMVARDEQRSPEEIRQGVANGTIVIPANRGHQGLRPIGIGRTLRTKVNVNLGASSLVHFVDEELEKVRLALALGADAIMDLSTGGEVREIRARILAECWRPLGTVPIYEAPVIAPHVSELDAADLLQIVERQAQEGVDFMTIHAGLLRRHVPLVGQRLIPVVSRGGALMLHWMQRRNAENPWYERFDDLLSIAREYDVTLSLGDGLRPGCLHDATDAAQLGELQVLGELVRRCRAAGVQAMVEGPGHIPLNQIERNMQLEREWCDDAPFYVLGPVVTDCAPGYDHITGAVGGAWAAWHGAAMLCYVTPAEHLGLPTLQDVREGLIAFKIAAHAADVARGIPGARERDDRISFARVHMDWAGQFENALDPDAARQRHAAYNARAGRSASEGQDYCTMCGPNFCPMRLVQPTDNVPARTADVPAHSR